MRIKSGGSARSQSAKGAKGAKKAGKASKAFSKLVEGEGPIDTEEGARQVRNALLEELSELAKEVKDGKATDEEASRRFALAVIRERFGDQNKGKGQKNMEDAIGDLVENDPNFVSRLSAQLKKISKS